MVSVQGAGLSVSLRKCKNTLWSLCQFPPCLQQHLPAVAGLPTGVEGVGELCFAPTLPVHSCFWLGHRILPHQSSCGYPEWEEFPRMP